MVDSLELETELHPDYDTEDMSVPSPDYLVKAICYFYVSASLVGLFFLGLALQKIWSIEKQILSEWAFYASVRRSLCVFPQAHLHNVG